MYSMMIVCIDSTCKFYGIFGGGVINLTACFWKEFSQFMNGGRESISRPLAKVFWCKFHIIEDRSDAENIASLIQ